VDSHSQLAIVQKYERFINYFYPVAQNIPKAHGVLREMKMSFSHWSVNPVSRGINFLGYRIWPGHKLIRKSSVHRARRKIKAMVARGDDEAIERFIGSWAGHINKADVYNLKIALNEKHDIRGKLELARIARHQTRDFLLGEMFT
jgi:hypothetical protein